MQKWSGHLKSVFCFGDRCTRSLTIALQSNKRSSEGNNNTNNVFMQLEQAIAAKKFFSPLLCYDSGFSRSFLNCTASPRCTELTGPPVS